MLDKLERAIAVHAEWQAAGQPVPAAQLLAAHPDLADQLAALLADPDETERAIAFADGEMHELGDFRLVAEIGRGGMGVVYRARQRSLDREVALKVLASHITRHPTAVARFRREATLSAKLEHPNLIAIHSVGQDRDAHFFAMECIDGGSLTRTDPVTGVQRTVRATVELCVAVADALQHAHERGVLHRDVKPSNILVRRNGQPVLTDFGLARELGEPGITHSGQFAGTPWYASPEQLADSRRADARADVWSLGATMYELLTGRRPFEAESSQGVIEKIRTSDPIDPLRLLPDLAPDLAAIVLKALEKNPARRYPSAAALRDDLRAFLEFRPVSARRAGRLTQAMRWLQRHPGWRAATVVVLLAVPLVPLLLSLAVAGERDRAVAAERLARRNAYSASLLAANTALAAGDGTQAEALLAACPTDLRGFEWHFVSRGLDTSAWTGSASDRPIAAVALSRDAALLAAGDELGGIAVFDVVQGVRRWQHPSTTRRPIVALGFAADGDWLVAADADGALTSFAGAHGTVLATVPGLGTGAGVAITADASTTVRGDASGRFERFTGRMLQPAGTSVLASTGDRPRTGFVTDGQRIVGVPHIGGLAAWDLTSAKRLATVPYDSAAVRLAAADGLRRTVGFDTRFGFVWWERDGISVQNLHHGTRPIASLAVSPDGRHVAAGSSRGELVVYDLGEGRMVRVLQGHRTAVRATAVAPGGWVATGADDGSVKLWNLFLDASSGELAGASFGASLQGVSFGRTLATDASGSLYTGGFDGTVRRIDVASGALLWQRQLPHWINGLAVVEGGRTIAAACNESIFVLDAGDGSPRGEPLALPGTTRARRVVADPDGRRLALLDENGRVAVVDVRARAVHATQPIVPITPLTADGRVTRTGGMVWTVATGLCVAGEDGAVRRIDAETLAVIGGFPVDGAVSWLAVDGDDLLVAQWDAGRRRARLTRRSPGDGEVHAQQEITSEITGIARVADRIAVARGDGRLGIHHRVDLEPIVELPQPAPLLWAVLAHEHGDWFALQCHQAETRVLWARPQDARLADTRARARRAAASQLAADALLPTGWTPHARAVLTARSDLPLDLREAAIAALPPTAAWRLIDIALHHGYSVDAARDPDRLLALRTCLSEATVEDGNSYAPARHIALALVELRLARPAAALDALTPLTPPAGDPPWWLAVYHFVRCLALAQQGSHADAAVALTAMRTSLAADTDGARTDLLREAEAAVQTARR